MAKTRAKKHTTKRHTSKKSVSKNNNLKKSTETGKKKRKNRLSGTKKSCYNRLHQRENKHRLSEYEAFWQNLTITDDFIFGKIMLDQELCVELLRRIFPQYEIERIEYIKVQESIQMDKESKGIRLDVFVKDNKNVAFCVEMQTRNVDNLPKRSRYYQSLVDLELLDRGQAYDDLSPSYVIFICPMDLFHLGYHIYEFRNYCTQKREMELGDQAVKIFLNAKGKKDDISPALKEFLDYVVGKENEEPSEFIVKLKVALYHAKQNREWRRQRMILYFRDQDIRAQALQQGREEGRLAGLEEGRLSGLEEGRKQMILSMLSNGHSREAVMQVAAITEEELDAILSEQ